MVNRNIMIPLPSISYTFPQVSLFSEVRIPTGSAKQLEHSITFLSCTTNCSSLSGTLFSSNISSSKNCKNQM